MTFELYRAMLDMNCVDNLPNNYLVIYFSDYTGRDW